MTATYPADPPPRPVIGDPDVRDRTVAEIVLVPLLALALSALGVWMARDKMPRCPKTRCGTRAVKVLDDGRYVCARGHLFRVLPY